MIFIANDAIAAYTFMDFDDYSCCYFGSTKKLIFRSKNFWPEFINQLKFIEDGFG